MFNTESTPGIGHDRSSLSPKRSQIDLIGEQDEDSKQPQTHTLLQGRITPFRTDAKQYMDKVLNLMTLINEVDDLTNVAELKNKLQM